MAKHIWTIICKRAITDRDSGNLSIIEIIDTMTIQGESSELPVTTAPVVARYTGKFIVFPADIALISRWRRTDPETAEVQMLRLRLLDPAGRALAGSFPLSVDLTKEFQTQIVARLPQLLVSPGGGIHTLQLQAPRGEGENQGWRTAVKVPLTIVQKIDLRPNGDNVGGESA